MKKLLVTLAALAIGMSSLFAWTNIPTLGITGPVLNFINPIDSELDTIKINGTGLNLGYIGYFDFGLAFKDSTSIGFGTAHSNYFDNMESPSFGPLGIDITEIIGVGYGAIRTDNLFLGVFGNVGFSTDVAAAAKKTDEYNYGQALVVESFLVGADVTVVYTPSTIFSLFGSVSVNAAFGGIQTASEAINRETDRRNEHTDSFFAEPFVKILPTVGIAWKF